MKITRDRTPICEVTDGAMGFSVHHVVSRTVRDSAAMLDATGYPEPGSPYAPPHKDRPYLEEVQASPGKLRIAWSSETPSGRPIDPQIQAALERTAALLKSLGHEVIEKGLGIDYRALFASRGPAAAANFAAGMSRLIEVIGHEPEADELEPLTWASLKAGRRQTGADVMRSLQDTRMLARQVVAFFEDIDVYLTPVLGTPVPEIGLIDPVRLEPREVNRRQSRAFPFTPPFNFSGQPSMSLPIEVDAEGLPIGMMFTGRYADEATLFRLAAQLEKEAPWKDRRPQVWG
jgi:amidase